MHKFAVEKLFLPLLLMFLGFGIKKLDEMSKSISQIANSVSRHAIMLENTQARINAHEGVLNYNIQEINKLKERVSKIGIVQ